MPRVSSKHLSPLPAFIMVMLLLGVAASLESSFGLHAVSAQRKSQTRPPRPAATPVPNKPPTSLSTMGAPPPIPKHKPKPTPEPEITAGDTISVDTTEVLLPVTVRDTSGKLVNN